MNELRAKIIENAERVMQLPDIINEKMEQNNHTEEIRGLEDRQKEIMLDFETKAGFETDDDGKKIYTNQKMREMRARELAATDEEYNTVTKRLKELRDVKAMLSQEIAQLQNEFSARKSVLSAQKTMLYYDAVELYSRHTKQKVEVALCQMNS